MASKKIMERVDRIIELINELKSDFEDEFDNASEAWQDSEKGELCMDNISACDEAISALEQIE